MVSILLLCLCSSKEEHPPVERKVGVSESLIGAHTEPLSELITLLIICGNFINNMS